MQDFEVFEEALSQDTTYMSSLTRSMSLVLDEFYQNLRTVGVSSMTGAGFDEFLKAVDDAVVEFETQYKPGKPVFDVITCKPVFNVICKCLRHVFIPFASCIGIGVRAWGLRVPPPSQKFLKFSGKSTREKTF